MSGSGSFKESGTPPFGFAHALGRWVVLLVVVFVEFEEAGKVALIVDLLDQDGEAA